MQCPHCEYTSAAERYPAPFLARHLKNEHGYGVSEAIAVVKGEGVNPAAELARLRDENARLREAMGEAAQLIKDDYQGSALAVLRAALEVAK